MNKTNSHGWRCCAIATVFAIVGGARLAHADANLGAPATKPSGGFATAFAYNSPNHDSGTLYVMAADGAHPVPVFHFKGDCSMLRWSPDGARLLFCTMGEGTQPEIHIWCMNADGTGAVNLTPGDKSSNSPAWSRQGRIAFSAYRDGRPLIHIMNADGTGVKCREGVEPKSHDGALAWSPDGKKIVFATSLEDGTFSLHIMDADGGHVTRLTNRANINSEPAWSPDGRTIAFNSAGPRDHRPDGISLIDAAGGEPRELPEKGGECIDPKWSPDGRSILARNGTNKRACVLDATTGVEIRLLGPDEDCLSADWLPDGRTITLFTYKDEALRNYRVNADGSNLRKWRPVDGDGVVLPPVFFPLAPSKAKP